MQLESGQQKLGKSMEGNSEGQWGSARVLCSRVAQDSWMTVQWDGTGQLNDWTVG